MIAKPFE